MAHRSYFRKKRSRPPKSPRMSQSRTASSSQTMFFSRVTYWSNMRLPSKRFPRRPHFPDKPCIKKVYKNKKSVSPLVSSQEQRALLVPRFNRGFCSPVGLYRISLVRSSGVTRRRVFDALEVRGKLVSGANSSLGIQSCPATPPSRRASGMSGFWVRQVRMLGDGCPSVAWSTDTLRSSQETDIHIRWGVGVLGSMGQSVTI